MATMLDLNIAGRTYQVACREGEEENLRAAARLVDGKSREALAGLGTLSEARQFLFASLLLADQLIDNKPERRSAATAGAGQPSAARSGARSCAPKRSPIASNRSRWRLRTRPQIPKFERDGHYPVRAFGKSLRRLDIQGSCPCPDHLGFQRVRSTRRPPDVLASEDFRANGHGGPVTSLLPGRPAGLRWSRCPRSRCASSRSTPARHSSRRSPTRSGRCSNSGSPST